MAWKKKKTHTIFYKDLDTVLCFTTVPLLLWACLLCIFVITWRAKPPLFVTWNQEIPYINEKKLLGVFVCSPSLSSLFYNCFTSLRYCLYNGGLFLRITDTRYMASHKLRYTFQVIIIQVILNIKCSIHHVFALFCK